MEKSFSDKEFRSLIYDNQHIIHKVCNMYCHTTSDKEDLFQEIVIKLWKGLPSFKKSAKLSTWMYRVALNTAISDYRKKKNLIQYENFEGINIPDVGGEEQAEKERQIKALYAGINQLKKIEKAIILLYLEEKSYEEIAEITGLSKSNVSVKLVRIKTKLEGKVRGFLGAQ